MSLKKRLLFGISFFVISLTLIFLTFEPSAFQMGLITITSLCTTFIIKFKKRNTY
jgi:hypothetical protein